FPISINAVDASGATIIGDAPYVDLNGDPLGIVVGTDLAAPYSSGFTFAAGACSASGSSTFTFTTPGQTAGMMSLGVIHPVFHITAIGNAVINTKLTIPPATGVLSMSLTCAQPLDVCSNGIPPSVSFVAVNNTATITLAEPGWTNPPFSQGLALSGDTCNQNDSPGAQGNWAVFTPGKGGVASTFSVKATGVGTPKAPSTCAATFIDPLGAHITMSIQVTASSIGVQ
ncbi:MAG: hypothetical protein ABI282_06660, partial [Candidatus Baltobacteraceae bacterium]